MAEHGRRQQTGWEMTRDVALGLGILQVFGAAVWLLMTWRMFGTPILEALPGALLGFLLCFGLYLVARRKAAASSAAPSS